MRKLLYGTSALVAAGLLQADPAFAQAKESPVTVSVGGRFHAFYAWQADNAEGQLPSAATSTNRGPIRDHGLLREAEILFRGRTALNNGLRVGVHVGLEAETCTDQIDESYIWFEHDSFGRLEIGSTDQVGWKMFYGAPNAIPNFSTAQINMRAYNVGGGINALAGSPQALLNLANDDEHINYFTPRFFGFQIGVSYTPEQCEEVGSSNLGTCTGGAGLPINKTAGEQGDIFEIAANFVQKFGDFNVGVYGAYNRGDLEAPAAATAAAAKDQEQWGVGANVGFYGFTLGAHYKADNQGLRNGNYDSWGAGLSYAWSAWKIGLEAGFVSARDTFSAAGTNLGVIAKDRMWNASAGVQWSGLGPGMNIWGGALYYDARNGNPELGGCVATCKKDSNDGIVFVLGTTISY
jgi:predicted porin